MNDFLFAAARRNATNQPSRRTRVELMTDLLINELAPCTRRDEWWSTDGPYEIIAKYIRFAVRSEVIVMSKKGKGGKGKGKGC